MGAERQVVYGMPEAVARKCEICSHSEMEFLYSLPCYDGPYRDGQAQADRPYWKCSSCGFVFTTSYDHSLYESYYRALAEDYHKLHDGEQSRYELVRHALNGHRSLRILDYGCGTGTFLGSLPATYEKYGIELSKSAGAEAERKGIRVVTPSALREPGLRRSFDVVVAIDVVEHVRSLSGLRDLFADSLRNGGLLLLLTGNVESRAARKAGRYWYYLQYAEHISFLAERSAKSWLEPVFEDISFQEVSHHASTTSEQFKALAKFPVAWILEKAGVIQRLKRFPSLHPSSDHLLITARRRPSNGGFGE